MVNSIIEIRGKETVPERERERDERTKAAKAHSATALAFLPSSRRLPGTPAVRARRAKPHPFGPLTEASEVAWSLAVAELTLAVKASRASRNGV